MRPPAAVAAADDHPGVDHSLKENSGHRKGDDPRSCFEDDPGCPLGGLAFGDVSQQHWGPDTGIALEPVLLG